MAEWTITVSQLNEYVRRQLAGDPLLRSVQVEGEISGFRHHISGHKYFTLKDDKARVQCVMFRQSAQSLDFSPREGTKVIASGSASLFVRDGSYQLYVESMREAGTGDLYLEFERRKKRLADEGLFDPALKRPLPTLPVTMGVVTALGGAALQDILRVSRARNPRLNIVLAPCAVQGEGAAEEIARAIGRLNRRGGVDVMLVGRGGGSIEDLWAFNEEVVARAIRASAIPVVSCVGHEIDFTIADFAADVRAATPSNGAELAVPVLAEAQADLAALWARSTRTMQTRLHLSRARLAAVGASSALTMPGKLLVDSRRAALELLHRRQNSAMAGRMQSARARLAAVGASSVLTMPGKLLVDSRRATLEFLRQRGERAAHARLARAREELAALGGSGSFILPQKLTLARQRARVELLRQQGEAAMTKEFSAARRRLDMAGRALEAMNPSAVIQRGYAVVERQGALVGCAGALRPGDPVSIRMHGGRAEAVVTAVEQSSEKCKE